MSDFKKGDTASWDSEQVRRSQPAPKRTARPRKRRRRRRINPFVYILFQRSSLGRRHTIQRDHKGFFRLERRFLSSRNRISIRLFLKQ